LDLNPIILKDSLASDTLEHIRFVEETVYAVYILVNLPFLRKNVGAFYGNN
jgi:hypothetical protein